MYLLRHFTAALVASASFANPLWAEDIALVLTNRVYANGQETSALRFNDAARGLRAEGFRVIGGDNLQSRVMAERVQEFRNELTAAEVERVVVLVSGRVVAAEGNTWLLGRESGRVSDLTAPLQGVSLQALDGIVADYPGQALMAVAPSWRSRQAPGQGLRIGLGAFQPGQGVTLMSGFGSDVAKALDGVLNGTEPLADVAARMPHGVSLRGYLPRNTGFASSAPDPVDNSDAAYWSAVRDVNSADGYRAYLRRFPNGLFVGEARRLLQGLADEPRRQAEAEEQALQLSRLDKRGIQRDLTLLGYDTRGVDGVFGRGTRAAISTYQRSRGFEDTGYVTRAMMTRLSRDASAKRSEVEAEDRAYWQRTGITGLEEDLRLYLNRYPNGLFADDARAQLAAIERERDAADDERARLAWRLAQDADTVQAYRDFLRRYPDGPYSDQARVRIQELRNPGVTAEKIAQDKAEERTVAGNPVARLLIEKGLEKTGHNPGQADGRFDNQTRKAIKSFQRSANIPPTGYMTQQTMAALTAASLR